MSTTFVKLPSGYVEIEWLRDVCEDLINTPFKFMKWEPRPALIDKNGKVSRLYTGQKYDPNYIDLVEDGWTHDHCQICDLNISDYENENTVTSGYFNAFDWVCKNCYEAVLDTDDFEKRLNDLPKKGK